MIKATMAIGGLGGGIATLPLSAHPVVLSQHIITNAAVIRRFLYLDIRTETLPTSNSGS